MTKSRNRKSHKNKAQTRFEKAQKKNRLEYVDLEKKMEHKTSKEKFKLKEQAVEKRKQFTVTSEILRLRPICNFMVKNTKTKNKIP